MKHFLVGLLFMVSLATFGQVGPVNIKLKIANKEANGKVYLERINDRGFGAPIDSVKIEGQEVTLSTVIPEPGIYQLKISNEQVVGLILDGGEEFEVFADGITTDDKPASVRINGLPNMVVFNELQTSHFAFDKDVKAINDKFSRSSNDAEREKLRESYLVLLKKHNETILPKVQSLGTSAAGLLAANNFLNKDVYMPYFITLAEQIKAEGKKGQFANFFMQMVNEGRMGQPGVEAPDFELKTLDGKTVKLSDYRGKRVVIDFWATWCGPCIMSFPGMKLAMEKYADRDDVAFLFVHTFERVPQDQVFSSVQKFVHSRELGFLNTLMDVGSPTSRMYGVGSIPAKFFVDEEGKFLYKSLGYAGSEQGVVDEISQWFDK